MTAETGDGTTDTTGQGEDGVLCNDCLNLSCSAYNEPLMRQNMIGVKECRGYRNKLQPQVAPLDIPAMLVAMIYTLDKAIDQSPYDKEKDALIDAMEQLQVAAKVSAEVAQFEDQEDYPLAPGVPMR